MSQIRPKNPVILRKDSIHGYAQGRRDWMVSKYHSHYAVNYYNVNAQRFCTVRRKKIHLPSEITDILSALKRENIMLGAPVFVKPNECMKRDIPRSSWTDTSHVRYINARAKCGLDTSLHGREVWHFTNLVRADGPVIYLKPEVVDTSPKAKEPVVPNHSKVSPKGKLILKNSSP